MALSPGHVLRAVVEDVLTGTEVGLVALLKEMCLERFEMLLSFGRVGWGALPIGLSIGGTALRC
jgi:hypothetical protein